MVGLQGFAGLLAGASEFPGFAMGCRSRSGERGQVPSPTEAERDPGAREGPSSLFPRLVVRRMHPASRVSRSPSQRAGPV